METFTSLQQISLMGMEKKSFCWWPDCQSVDEGVKRAGQVNNGPVCQVWMQPRKQQASCLWLTSLLLVVVN